MTSCGGCSRRRQPLKKIEANEEAPLKLLHRWRTKAGQAGREIKRIVAAYEAGRDGFWLARWLRARHVKAYVIHPASVAVSREHRRAKTDRLDTELLAFLGWLRGEKRHCSMAAIPTVAEEDARRPNRERGNLVTKRTRIYVRLLDAAGEGAEWTEVARVLFRLDPKRDGERARRVYDSHPNHRKSAGEAATQ